MKLVTRHPLTHTFGTVIGADWADPRLDHVSRDDLLNAYARSGAVLLRGFDPTLEEFERMTSQYLRETVVNGNATRDDVVADKRIQTVNRGHAMIPLHAEMAYGPLRPDVLFFCCLEAPHAGSGETLLCDGTEVWRRMRASTRDAFERKRLRYRFRDSQILGAQYRGYDVRIAADPGVTYFQRQTDGCVDLDFVVPAASPPRHGSECAFANSVIVEKDRVAFEDDEPITDALRRELFALTTAVSYPLVWQSGDVLMIDNSRVMHGRRACDPFDGRRIVLRMGFDNAPA